MADSPQSTADSSQQNEVQHEQLNISQFPYTQLVPTRWHDNDQYGHINNTIYYSVMDTAVNTWLIETAGFDPETAPEIGVVVSSSCEYKASAAFPDVLKLGVACGRLGKSSVAWRTGVFLADGDKPLAEGEFVHVFVDRETMRPVPMPARIREHIEQNLIARQSPSVEPRVARHGSAQRTEPMA